MLRWILARCEINLWTSNVTTREHVQQQLKTWQKNLTCFISRYCGGPFCRWRWHLKNCKLSLYIFSLPTQFSAHQMTVPCMGFFFRCNCEGESTTMVWRKQITCSLTLVFLISRSGIPGGDTAVKKRKKNRWQTCQSGLDHRISPRLQGGGSLMPMSHEYDISTFSSLARSSNSGLLSRLVHVQCINVRK